MCLADLLRKFCGVVIVLLFFDSQGSAESNLIWQMLHNSWRGHDGAPQGIDALGQASDGTIWMAASDRLYRFDGIRFERYVAAPGTPEVPQPLLAHSIVSAKNGDLWVFRIHGVPLVLRQGRVEPSHTDSKNPHDDTTWMGALDTEGRLFAIQDDHKIVELGPGDTWFQTKRYPQAKGFLTNLAIDRENTAWLVQDRMLFRLRVGATQAENMNVAVGLDSQIVPLPDHTLWIMSRWAPAKIAGQRIFSLRHIDNRGVLLERPLMVQGIDYVLASSEGALWVTAQNRGTWKLPLYLQPRSHKRVLEESSELREDEHFVPTAAGAMIEAQDGSIWIGGNTGLDSFRQAKIVPAMPSMHPGLWTVCANNQAGVWLADDVRTLSHIEAEKTTSISGYQNKGLGVHLACGQDETIWLSTAQGLAEIKNGKLQPLPAIPFIERDQISYGGLAYAKQHLTASIAVGASQEQQLWTFTAGQWKRELPNEQLEIIFGLYRDENKDLYLTFMDGSIRLLRHGHLKTIGTAQQDYGRLYGFAKTSYGLIVYGRKGLALIQDETVYPLLAITADDLEGITGVVEALNQDLWTTGGNGIVNLPAASIKARLSDGKSKLKTIRVVEGDYAGPDSMGPGRSSACKDSSGRLWFATAQGVVSIDPSSVFSRLALPIVSVRSISSDRLVNNSKQEFAAGTTDVRISYMGLLLSAPKSVTYRYRLIGAETEWHPANEATPAMYAHLQPGSYRFEVMASNGYDMWTHPVQSLPFRILPHFWQTAWFSIGLLALGIWLLRLLFRQQLRAAKNKAQLIATQRAEERSRIARELHDTLLQGIQGLLLSFEVVRQRLRQGNDVTALLDRSLTATEALVVEGRDRIAALRQRTMFDSSLPKELHALCANLQAETGVDVHFRIVGTARDLYPNVAEELFLIGREALKNAIKHAQSSKMQVVLHYGRRQLRLQCEDNGRGFDVSDSLLGNDSTKGWGLQGMRERSASIRAQLKVHTQIGHGTQVNVRIDSKYAYTDD